MDSFTRKERERVIAWLRFLRRTAPPPDALDLLEEVILSGEGINPSQAHDLYPNRYRRVLEAAQQLVANRASGSDYLAIYLGRLEEALQAFAAKEREP